MTRVLLRCLVALILAAATVASVGAGWRVLRPSEVLDVAREQYPLEASRPQPGFLSRSTVAALPVDGRVRVFASARQVRADTHFVSRTQWTPDWSYRRWPAKLSGVVSYGSTVVTRWSDGKVIAIDAASGTISWRADGVSGADYTGAKTGAATVWSPPGLHLAGATVVAATGRTLAAYDVSTGTRRWSVTVPAGCTEDSGFTTEGGQYVCATGAYDTATGRPIVTWPAGPYEKMDCELASSNCVAMRDGASRGWRTGLSEPVRDTDLDRAGSTLAAGAVFYPEGDRLRVVGSDNTYPLGRVLGTSDGRAIILTAGNALVEVDPGPGLTTFDVPLVWPGRDDPEGTDFTPGLIGVGQGLVGVERLTRNGPSSPSAGGHYFSNSPVLTSTT